MVAADAAQNSGRFPAGAMDLFRKVTASVAGRGLPVRDTPHADSLKDLMNDGGTDFTRIRAGSEQGGPADLSAEAPREETALSPSKR
jgi:hypothetical protein